MNEERERMKRRKDEEDMSLMMGKKEDDIDKFPERKFDEDEIAELMQQR